MKVNEWYDCWDLPSTQLAYFLGVLCSDGCVTKYTFEITVAEKDKNWLGYIRDLMDYLFGVPTSIGVIIINGKCYPRLWVCSKFFKERVDLRDEDGEWGYNLFNKFSWIDKEDVFFWSFMSGLFDGDGSLCIHKKRGGSKNYPIASIAIHPKKTREMIEALLELKGVKTAFDSSCSLEVRGGKKATYSFMGKLSCYLKRKQLGNLFK